MHTLRPQSNLLVQPQESCPSRDILVSHDKLQVPATICPLENSDACAALCTASNQIRFTIRTFPKLHSANLVQPCEDLIDELKTFVGLSFVDVLEDGNGIAFCESNATFVSVGHVNVGGREAGRDRRDEDLGCCILGIRRRVGRGGRNCREKLCFIFRIRWDAVQGKSRG